MALMYRVVTVVADVHQVCRVVLVEASDIRIIFSCFRLMLEVMYLCRLLCFADLAVPSELSCVKMASLCRENTLCCRVVFCADVMRPFACNIYGAPQTVDNAESP